MIRKRAAIILFFGVLLFRIAHVFLFPPNTVNASDSERHWQNALDVLAKTPTAIWDPFFYQFYLGTVLRMTGGIPILLTASSALLSATCLIAWYLAASMLLPQTGALFVASFLGLIPGWVSLYSFFLTETIFLPLLGLSLAATFQNLQEAERTKKLRSFVWAVLLWILTSLTRPIVLPLGCFLIAFAWWQLPGSKKMRAFLYSVAIGVVILGPLGMRNSSFYQVTNPFGGNPGNSVMGETGAFWHELNMKRDGASWTYAFDTARGTPSPFSPFFDYKSIRKGKASISLDLSGGNYTLATDRPKPSLEERVLIVVDDGVFTLLGVPWPYISSSSSPYAELGWYTRWMWTILALFLPLLVLASRPLTTSQRLLSISILLWFGFQICGMFISGQARYRLPFEGLSILLVASLVFRTRSKETRDESISDS